MVAARALVTAAIIMTIALLSYSGSMSTSF